MRCESNHCVYFKRISKENYVILRLYMDDMLVARTRKKDIKNHKERLPKIFNMKDLGEARQILGMKITRDK